MIDTLKRTLVGTRDLSEQTPSAYVLIVGGVGGRAYYYVDDWRQIGSNMEFFREGTVVYVCRQEGLWGVIHRSLTETYTNEDMIRLTKKDGDTLEALQKELEPPADGPDTPAHDGRGIYL